MAEILNIYQKLHTIQQTLKANKGQYNNFGKYHYRSCEDILEALKPTMAKTSTILIIKDEIIMLGDRFYVKATARLQCTQCDAFMESEAYAREELTKKGMDGSQVTGASSSYARKYALNGLFAIDDTKDSDATNAGQKQSDDDIKGKLEKMLLHLAKNNKDKVLDALEYYTKFKGKDGKEVAGIKDISKLSDARLKATYGKVKADYLKNGGQEL